MEVEITTKGKYKFRIKFIKHFFSKNYTAEVRMLIVPDNFKGFKEREYFKGFKERESWWALLGAYPFNIETGAVGFVKRRYRRGHYNPFGNHDEEIRRAWRIAEKTNSQVEDKT